MYVSCCRLADRESRFHDRRKCMRKSISLCLVLTLAVVVVLFAGTEAFSATLNIKPSAATPGATLTFTASDDLAGTQIMVKQTNSPWTSERVMFGSGTVSFNSGFTVPSGAAQGTKFCFALVRTAIPQRQLPSPVQIAGPVCARVVQAAKTVPQAGAAITTAQLCPDPVAKLTMTKSLSGGTVTVKLIGTVCNEGTVDYVGTDSLDAFFMVYTRHPPKTYAQEHDLKDISHHAIGKKLVKGQCKTIHQTYTIPNVASLGNVATVEASRQAVKQFVFGVDRNLGNNPSFSNKENCSNTNDRGVVELEYREKVQGPVQQIKDIKPRTLGLPDQLKR